MLAERLTLALAGLALAAGLQAQDTLLLRDYRAAQRSDAWLTSPNAAALTRYSLPDMGTAQLSLTRARGGLTDFYDSPNVTEATAAVESYFRLNARTVLFGAISYDNFAGRDMAGSAFIGSRLKSLTSHFSPLTSHFSPLTSHFSPLTSHLPFDIVEDSLNNTGKKHRDVYSLSGAFGIDLWRGVAVGARLDYTAANYAKYKDLRHKNKLMDLQLTASLYVPLGSVVQLGVGYLYLRNTESVLFSTYGKSDRVYNSFINYGPYIGQVEQFGSTGYTDRSREMPLVSDADGVNAQLSVQPTARWQLYNAFAYAHRRGYYGRPSPYTVTYTRHRSHLYDYTARLSHMGRGARCHLDFGLQAENLQNNASVYRELQNDAGASYYEYYTPVKTANRLWVDGNVSLTADLQPLTGGPSTPATLTAWTLQAGLRWAHRKQTAYLYPYARRQRITAREYFGSIGRNLVATGGVWSFQIGASFRQGSGQPYEDLTLATPSDKQTEPPTMEAYLWREHQWLTAAQYSIGGSVQYSFPMPATGMKTYVRASLHHRKANQTYDYSAGRDRTTATLAVGCEF